jgi:hypothetical protein
MLMPEMPWGTTDDPRATPSDATVTELTEIRDKVWQANTLLEGIIEREARYSRDNGWQLPAIPPQAPPSSGAFFVPY